jgi:hypothetical protein
MRGDWIVIDVEFIGNGGDYSVRWTCAARSSAAIRTT